MTAAARVAEGGAAVAIRPATVADLAGCAAVVNGWIDETGWIPRVKTPAEIEAYFTPDLLDRRLILVADEGGRVGGYLSLASEGYVGAVYLRAGLRGRGVGRALIEAAKARHPGGLELEVFEVNADARRFYAREGFAEMAGRRRTDTDEGLPVLRLRWEGRG